MTQIAVAAGANASVTLAAGAKLLLQGQGVYRIGPQGSSQRATVDELIDTVSTIGPFTDSCVVQVWAGGGGATYEVVLANDVIDQTGRPVSGVSSFFSATGGGSGLVANGVQAPWAVAGQWTGKKGLIPEFGPAPLHYRSTATAGGGQVLTQPIVRDHLGVPRQTSAGQLLTWGQRIEENLIRSSDDLTNTTYWATNVLAATLEYSYDFPRWRQPTRPGAYVTRAVATGAINSIVRTVPQVLRAVPHRASFYIKVPSGSQTFEVRFYIVGSTTLVTSTFTVTAADGWKRLCLNLGTPDGSSSYAIGFAPGTYAGTGGGTILIGGVQLQERTGTETAPSEHIKTDGVAVHSKYWYGLGLDRIECFGTTNANTVNAGAFSATAGGEVVETAGTALTRYQCLSSPTVQQFARTDVNNWTQTRVQPPVTGIAAPDGSPTAYDILEDGTSSASHFVEYTLVGTNTYDNQFMVFSCFAKKRSAGDRGWIYVAFADLTATNKGAFFDLTNGVVGTVGSGLYACIEPWANGWYRCFVRGSVGAGTNDIKARLFVANGDNAFAPTTSTTSNGVSVWCPNVTGPLSSTGTARAMPHLPALNASTSIGLIPGSIVADDISGTFGTTDFAITGTTSLLGMIDEPYKSGTGFVYSSLVYCTSAEQAVRCGPSWRPGADGGASGHTLKIAGDVYVGEFNDIFYWKPNYQYSVGQIAIPLDTLPGNSNNRKMFTCVQAGTSGSGEPSWDPTYVATPDTVTNITPDGTVKWQANTNNGIASNWEEYLGIHLKPTQTGFGQQIKWGWYMTANDYGMFLNGEAGAKQTLPQFNNGIRPVLPRKLRLAWYGKQDGTAQWPEAAPSGYDTNAAMGVWVTGIQDRILYHTSPVVDAVRAATL